VARKRLAGCDRAELEVADVRTFDPAGRSWDVVLGAMWTFFAYLDDAERAVATLRAATRSKLIVDRNPRTHPLDDVAERFRAAGFQPPEVRPVTVPLSRRSTPVVRAAGRALSAIEPAWKTLVRRKLNVALLAEPGTA
jgi:hypothetical protein